MEKDAKVSAPNDFIRKLLNICIGGIRGKLSTKLINTELNHVTLPLLDLSAIKEEIPEKQLIPHTLYFPPHSYAL